MEVTVTELDRSLFYLTGAIGKIAFSLQLIAIALFLIAIAIIIFAIIYYKK